MNKLLKIMNEKAEEIFLVVILTAVTILVILQVFFRYVFHASLGWSEEIGRFALIWITWISASYAIRKGTHIRVEVVKNLFPSKVKKYIEEFVILLWFLFSAFLAVEGTKLVLSIGSTGQISPSSQIPMWFVYLAIPIGGILMGIRLIQEFYKIVRNSGGKEGNTH